MPQKHIKSRDITFLVIVLLCFRIFTNMPMLLVTISGTGAPLSALWGGIVFIALLLCLAKKQFPVIFLGKPFLKYSVSLIFLAYLLLSSVYYLREISEFTKLTAFPTSPLWFIMLFFMIAAIIGSISGAGNIIRLVSIFVPFALVIIALMLFSVLTQSDFLNLFPIFGTGVSDVLGKGLWGISLYSDITLLILLNSNDTRASEQSHSILWGAVIGTVINFAVILTFTAKIPYPISQNESFPVYLLLKEAYFGRFFHRIDALIIVVSSLWGMISLSLNLYFISFILSEIFGISPRKLTVFPISASIFFSALIYSEVPIQGIPPYIIFASAIILCATALTIIFSARKGKKKMKVKTFMVLCLSVFSLTGCYDQKEIDETAYIVALGIDNAEGNNFAYTFQFSSPLSIMGESSEKSEASSPPKQSDVENSSVTTLTIDAPDFYIAKNLTNNFLSKNVDMSHLKFIVFSADISADDLDTHSQLLLREREIRPHTAIAVSVDSTSKYLKNVNPELESNTSKYYELMSLRSNNVYAPPKKLHDFVDEYSAKNGDTVLPIAVSGKELKDFPKDNAPYSWLSSHNTYIHSDHSVLCGMAIFKNGKLVSAMSGDSALIFNILQQNIENCTITLRDKYNSKKTVSFRLKIPEKASYSINDTAREIIVTQSLEMDFLGGVLPNGYSSFKELFSYAESVLSDRISVYFQDISLTRAVDIMNLRNHIRKHFLTWDNWNNFDWNDFYKNAKFVVNISVSQGG